MNSLTINNLAHFWQLAHRAQAACANVHVPCYTINLKATALHVKYKATARTMLRKWNVIAVHWLTLANITTSCRHISSSQKIATNTKQTLPCWKVLGMLHVFVYLIILKASVILHPENSRNDWII